MDLRLRYLDGLRGILAIMVFLHHFFYIFYPEVIFGGNYEQYLKPGYSFYKLMAFTPLNLFYNPGAAIHLFFILSGYVQTYHYFQKPDLILVQKSFLKRYFRLAIPTLTVVILVYLFHKFHLITKNLVPSDPVTGSWTQSMLPNNLGFLKVIKHGLADIFVTSFRYYQVLWTMPIELMNSWMILILLFVTHHLKNRVGLFIFWIIVQLFFIQSFYGVAFTFGMLICYSEQKVPSFRNLFSKTLVKVLAFCVGIYFASYPYIGYEKSTIHGFYGPISFFEKYPHIISYLFGDLLLFCLLLRSNYIKTLFQKKIFRFYGDISFMFYLVHLLILLSFSPWLFNYLMPKVSRKTNLTITAIVSFLVISAVSKLLFEGIDKPVLKYCNAYLKKFFGI